MNHDSPASIRSLLESRSLAPRKRWGQNFLINRGAREKILSLLDVEAGQTVWEIGGGLGAMSRLLLDRGVNLTIFEIDPAYCLWLEEYLAPGSVNIVQGNVMNTWPEQWQKSPPQRILGNLPYNMASAVIASFIETGKMAPLNVFTVQDEMGQRMKAAAGTKNYSSFSVLCQSAAGITDGGRLSPGSFYPAPRVHSRIVLLRPGEPCGTIHNPKLFRLLVRALFSSRRKTLANNLKAAALNRHFPELEAVKRAFDTLGIELSRRPETVSPEEWVALSNSIALSGEPS